MSFWDTLLLVLIGSIIIRYGISGLLLGFLILTLGSWLFFLIMFYVFNVSFY